MCDVVGNVGVCESVMVVLVDDDVGGGMNLWCVLLVRVLCEVLCVGECGVDVCVVWGGKRVGTVGEELRVVDEGRDGVFEML